MLFPALVAVALVLSSVSAAAPVALPYSRSLLPVEPLEVLAWIAVGADGIPMDVDVANIDERLDAELAPGHRYLALIARGDPNASIEPWTYHLYGPELGGVRPLLAVMSGSHSSGRIETLRVVHLNGLPALLRVLAIDGTGNFKLTTVVAEIHGVPARIADLGGNQAPETEGSAGLVWRSVNKYAWQCAPPVRFRLELRATPDGFRPVGYDVTPVGSAEPPVIVREGGPLEAVTDDEALAVATREQPQSSAATTLAVDDDQYAINALTEELFCGRHSFAQLRAARLVRVDGPRGWEYDALVVTRDEGSLEPVVWRRIATEWRGR